MGICKTAPEVRLPKVHTQSYSVNELRKSLKVNDVKLGVIPINEIENNFPTLYSVKKFTLSILVELPAF